MALNRNTIVSRKDDTKLVVGQEGEPLAQAASKKQIVRSGAAAAAADYDIIDDSDNTTWDLVAQGDYDIPEDDLDVDTPPSIGGTGELGGGIESVDGNSFDFTITWVRTDDQDNVVEDLYSQTFSSSGGAIELQSMTVKGDQFTVTLTDTSGAGQNNIKGTLNFH